MADMGSEIFHLGKRQLKSYIGIRIHSNWGGGGDLYYIDLLLCPVLSTSGKEWARSSIRQQQQ